MLSLLPKRSKCLNVSISRYPNPIWAALADTVEGHLSSDKPSMFIDRACFVWTDEPGRPGSSREPCRVSQAGPDNSPASTFTTLPNTHHHSDIVLLLLHTPHPYLFFHFSSPSPAEYHVQPILLCIIASWKLLCDPAEPTKVGRLRDC